MKRILLSLALLLGGLAAAQAQCVAVGGVNSVPQTGVACASEPSVASYAATGVGIIPAASATDIACIAGSASKVIRLQRISVSGSGTAISVPVLIRKNASVDTGGTLGTGVILPVAYRLDSAFPASVATLASYTGNPTVTDSAPGIIDSGNLGLVATTVGAAVQPSLTFDYMSRGYTSAPTLRAAAQQICVNLNATTPTALLNVTFIWTEAAQ